MNVCLMNDSFPPVIDGVSNAVFNYAEIIHRDHGPVVVATPQYPKVVDDYPFPVVRYPSFNTKRLVGYRAGYPFAPEALGKLSRQGIDLIHSHCPITSTMLARLLREQIDAPVIMTYHTKFDVDFAKALKARLITAAALKLMVANIESCDEVWVVSRGAGENLMSLGYEGDYIVMENGVDLPKGRVEEDAIHTLSEKHGLKGEVPLLLFVGRMMWYKGLKLILDSLAALKARGLPFQMVFIGGGTDKDEVSAYADKLGLGDGCLFTGPIYDRQELRTWYCRADLMVFPSTYDTNGLVVREAAACGLPSLLIRDSCAAEGVTDGRTGILAEENAASISAALIRALADLPGLKDMGQNAMDEIYISWDAAVNRAWERYQVVHERWKSGFIKRRHLPMDDFFAVSGDILEALEKVRPQRLVSAGKLKLRQRQERQ